MLSRMLTSQKEKVSRRSMKEAEHLLVVQEASTSSMTASPATEASDEKPKNGGRRPEQARP